MDTPDGDETLAARAEATSATPYIETHEYLDSVRNRASATARRYIAQARRSSGPRARLLRARAFRAERTYRHLVATLLTHME